MVIPLLIIAFWLNTAGNQLNQGRGLPCGPACVAIVQRVFGLSNSDADLARLADKDGMSNLASLGSALQARQLHVEAVRCTPQRLIEINAVAIIRDQVPLPASAKTIDHFVVLAGVDEDGLIVVIDPSLTSKRSGHHPADVALRYWTGEALLISDKPIVLASDSEAESVLTRAGLVAACTLSVSVAAFCLLRRRRDAPIS